MMILTKICIVGSLKAQNACNLCLMAADVDGRPTQLRIS